MFGRRKARRAAAQAVPPENAFRDCGQVYLFNREAARRAQELAESAAPLPDEADETDEQRPPV